MLMGAFKYLTWQGALALAIASAPALAGRAEFVNNGGDLSHLEYRGSSYLRMNSPDDGYMLQRDDKLYVVSGQPGQETVMDASGMMQMVGQATPKNLSGQGRLESLTKTGRSETVAGIVGEVWTLVQTDPQGRRKTTGIVLSKDKRVRELRDALFGFSRNMLVSSGKDTSDADLMIAELKKRGRGVLRFGDEMEVVSISDESIAMTRFALPAKPITMPGMSRKSSSASSPLRGGFNLGGLFGDKADRQKDRIADRTESEVDQAADKAVDKALNRAFDKLFGN